MTEVVWHDIECGRYTQDLPLWLALADEHTRDGEWLLDVGAGTGRVSLELARAGHRVVALDSDPALLAELARRAETEGLRVVTVCADARTFSLPDRRFSLILVPMQTLQLLDGEPGRRAFLSRAREHLREGAVVAMAIAMERDFEEFEWSEGDMSPLPDVAESEGRTYFSQPTAVRRVDQTFVLERRRAWIDADGDRTVSDDTVALDIVDVDTLHAAGLTVGLKPLPVREIPPTDDHIGSQVVIFAV